MCGKRHHKRQDWREAIEETGTDNKDMRNVSIPDFKGAAVSNHPTAILVVPVGLKHGASMIQASMQSDPAEKELRSTLKKWDGPAEWYAQKQKEALDFKQRQQMNNFSKWFNLGYDGKQRAKIQAAFIKERGATFAESTSNSSDASTPLNLLSRLGFSMPTLLISAPLPPNHSNFNPHRSTDVTVVSTPWQLWNVFAMQFGLPASSDVHSPMMGRNQSTAESSESPLSGSFNSMTRGDQTLREQSNSISSSSDVPKHNCGVTWPGPNEQRVNRSEQPKDNRWPWTVAGPHAAQQSTQISQQEDLRTSDVPAASPETISRPLSRPNRPPWFKAHSPKQEPGIVVSSTTTTSSRPLPDGRVESRTVLEKTFADGRRETTETIGQQAKSPDSSDGWNAFTPQRSRGDVPRYNRSHEDGGRRGWFWH